MNCGLDLVQMQALFGSLDGMHYTPDSVEAYGAAWH
jgi:hypothetical protein